MCHLHKGGFSARLLLVIVISCMRSHVGAPPWLSRTKIKWFTLQPPHENFTLSVLLLEILYRNSHLHSNSDVKFTRFKLVPNLETRYIPFLALFHYWTMDDKLLTVSLIILSLCIIQFSSVDSLGTYILSTDQLICWLIKTFKATGRYLCASATLFLDHTVNMAMYFQ